MDAQQRTNTAMGADIHVLAKTSMKQILGRGYFKQYKGSDKDISTDYAQIMGETRVQLLVDIETMKSLVEIKKEYDIMDKVRDEYHALQDEIINDEAGKEDGTTLHQAADEKLDAWSKAFHRIRIVPDGYSIFSPGLSGLLKGTNTIAENGFTEAFHNISDPSGVPFDDILSAIDGLLVGNGKNLEQSMIIPDEVKDALKKLAGRRNRNESSIGKIARRVTGFWKADVIYHPLRVLKYNIRNYHGRL